MFGLLFVVCIVEINDPGFENAFYLENRGQFNGKEGEDINVIPVWNIGITGKNILISFLCQGCFTDHLDLNEGFVREKSWNFLTNSSDVSFVSPASLNSGTSLVSVAVAKRNGVGIVGVAYDSQFSVCVLSKIESISTVISEIIRYYDYNSHIFVDLVTNSYFSEVQSFIQYNYRHISELNEFILDLVETGRHYLGTVIIVPSPCGPVGATTSTMSLFANYGESIVVSHSDYLGSSGTSPKCFAGTLVCVPSFGGNEIMTSRLFPQIPVSSYKSRIRIINSSISGFEASILSGIVALIMEANSFLTYRDIQYILILSSVKNDPLHPMWFKNAAGYWYNLIYGFGRVDSFVAVQLAKQWDTTILKYAYSYSASKMINLPLLYARQGILKVSFQIDSPEESVVEHVLFQFNLSIPEINLLRIILISPQHTKIEILQPDSSGFGIQYQIQHFLKEPYQILVRGFFGENAKGTWKVSIIDSGFIFGNNLTYANLIVKALKTRPPLPLPKKTAPISSTKAKSKLDFSIENTEIQCDSTITANATLDSLPCIKCSFYLANRSSNIMLPLRFKNIVNETFVISLPCLFSTNTEMAIVAQYREENGYASIPIKLVNPHSKSGVSSPIPYQLIQSDIAEYAAINISFIDHLKEIPPFGDPQNYVFSLFNLESNQRLSSVSFANYRNRLYYFNEQTKPPKGILTIVPVYQSNPSPCNTIIIPLVFLSYTPVNKSIFPIPLNTFCPIPEGIVVTPTNSTKKPNFFDSIYFISLVSFLISALFILICYTKGSKKTKIPSELDDQMLL